MPRCDHASAECIVHPNFWVCKQPGCANGPVAATKQRTGYEGLKGDDGSIVVYRRWSTPKSRINSGLAVGNWVRLDNPASDEHRWSRRWTIAPGGIGFRAAPPGGTYRQIVSLNFTLIEFPVDLDCHDAHGWLELK